MEKSKQKFAIIILIIVIAEILIKATLSGGNYFRQNPIYLGMQLFYFAAGFTLLFKFKVTGWYLFVFYYGYNFLINLIGLVCLYITAIEYSDANEYIDANERGYMVFISPLPPLIIYAGGLFICLRSNTRKLYEIKL